MAKVVINGKEYDVTKEEVFEAARKLTPGEIKSYYIEVDGREYPIKQVVKEVLDLPAVSFTSADAYRFLLRVGIMVHTKE